MSLTARLHIEGHNNEEKGIPILSCDFGFNQDTDGRGRATSTIRGGIINVTIRGIDDSEIIQWMVNTGMQKNGKITFSGVTSTGPARKIEFFNAFLISYHESFANESDIIIQLVISAHRLQISGVDHENLWVKPD